MKRVYVFIMVTVMTVLLVNPIFSQTKTSDPKALSTTAIPENLKVIFQKSCMDCHATGGKGIAKMKVNFSSWDAYTADKQAGKASAINKVITKGSMPPKGYIKSHPDAVITDAQKAEISKWSQELAQKK